MTDSIVTPPVVNDIPVRGGHGQFPVRRVYCVGRNYAVRTREVGSDPDREPPSFFCKPADAVRYVADGETGQFAYPTETKGCHCETKLVVVTDTGGRDIVVETATHHVYGYAIGLDMMRRDLRNAAKKDDRPWETSKALGGLALIDPITSTKGVAHPDKGAMTLSAGGHEYQCGDLPDPIWSVPETVAYLSYLFKLRPDDLIYTGTPEGVGPVVVGDLMVNKIDGVGELHVKVIWQTR